MNTDPSFTVKELLDHAGFVRSLALKLVRDPSRAEDIEQDTWIAALTSPPRREESPRPWLTAVARNFFRKGLRSEFRRERREIAAAVPEAFPSPAELLEREQSLQSVVEAVLSLEEPYRSSILLRFYEGLPPREIARRQGTPVETVRSRLSRGLEQLRERLDRRYGGSREAWCLGLLSLVGRKLPVGPTAAAGTTAISIGVLAMSWKIAAGIVLVGISVTFWALSSSGPSRQRKEEIETHVGSTERQRLGMEPTAVPATEEPEKTVRMLLPPKVQLSPQPNPPAQTNPGLGALLAGQILVDGKPPAEPLILTAKAEGISLNATTGPRGIFHFEEITPGWSGKVLLPDGYWIEKASPGKILNVEQDFREQEGVELDSPSSQLLLEAKKFPVIKGRVVEKGSGKPVPGARAVGDAMGGNENNSFMYGFGATADEAGRFRAPLLSSKVLWIEFSIERNPPEAGRFIIPIDPTLLDRDLDLGDVALPTTREIRFVVRDFDGNPVPGALTFVDRGVGGKGGPTDPQGRGTLLLHDLKAAKMEVGAIGYKIVEIAIPQEIERPLEILLERSNLLEIHLRDVDGKLPWGLQPKIIFKNPLFYVSSASSTEEESDESVPPKGSYPQGLHSEAGASGFAFGYRNKDDRTIVVGLLGKNDVTVLLSSLRPEVPFRIEFVDCLGFPAADLLISGLCTVEKRVEEVLVERKSRKLWGIVRDETGLPLANVTVEVSARLNSSKSLSTDREGGFLQPDLYAERVDLEIHKEGYQTLRAQGFSLENTQNPREFTLLSQ